jgi:hypothetical protein
MMDDRAVSEVVGFVLVFSLVTMTIAIVFTAGFGGLQDAQRAEQVNNVERAFDVLDTNVEEVGREGAPSRATEMRLSGGQLGFGEPTTVTVHVDGTETTTVETRPLVYANGDTEIAYELGAIVRTDDGGSVMLTDPGHVLNDDRSAVPLLVTTKPSDQTSIGGHRTVLVRGSHQRTDLLVTATTDEVTVTVESPRADVWERYFERATEQQTGGSVSRTDDTVEYAIASNETSVSVTWVRLRLV